MKIFYYYNISRITNKMVLYFAFRSLETLKVFIFVFILKLLKKIDSYRSCLMFVVLI